MSTNLLDQSDYLILGGGSAGCVLAARLSEDPACRVTLVEAGTDAASALIRTPAGTVAMLGTKFNNWGFKTVPQAGLYGRQGYQPRGRALGGSSATNAMIYIRGHRSDYDHWAALGNPGWGFDEVLPFFKRAEHNEDFRDAFHGQGGPLNVARSRSDNPFHLHWREAGREAGLPINDDFNGAEQEGLGSFQVTQKNGERCSSFRAYLEPALKRPNLRVLRGALAQRLLFEGPHSRRIVGAEVRHAGQRLQLLARRETLVCAGAFQSPQLLMVSGIGGPKALGANGIALRHALPGVGQNLHDHVDFVFGHRSRHTALMGLSLPGMGPLWRQLQRWRRERRGMLSTNFAEAGGFLRKSSRSLAPDFQLMFVVGLVEDHARKLHLRHGYSCHVYLLRPRSRGSVSLAGASMDTAPLIDPNFYGDAADLDDMVQGFKLTRRLLQTQALARHSSADVFTAGVHSDEQIRHILRERSDTVYHPVGSCRMGPATDRMAVVDAGLRVHGLAGLRVVDASVMPSIPGGNTNAPTIMVAEKAAQMVREEAA